MNDNEIPEIDLSSLLDGGLNPAWTSSSKSISIERASRGDRRPGKPHGKPFGPRGNGKFAPRGNAPRPFRGNDRGNAPTGENRGNDRGERPEFRGRGNGKFRHAGKPPRALPPTPVATLNFYPEDKPIIALVNAIKASGRTYTLFSIANLLLEKPERFNVMVSPLKVEGKEGVPAKPVAPLAVTVADNFPFVSEAEALAFACEKQFDEFFETAEIDVPAPKGDYKMVAICELDNGIIAAPNYHGYNLALHRYWTEHFPRMPFPKFLMSVRNSNDEVLVKSWLDSMTKKTLYILKERADGEPENFETKSAAKEFLARSRKEKLVTTAEQCRIAGTKIAELPKGKLLAQIEFELAKQRKFPLETANGFRGRLRHMGLSFYKKAPTGIAVVCGIRRKFRTPTTHFSDDIQRIFDYLDKNPETKLEALTAALLGENPADEEVRKLAGAVHWLVAEGYVCEMEKGELSAFKVMNEAEAKAAEKNVAPKERETLEAVEDESGITSSVPAMPETIAPEVLPTVEKADVPAESVPAETVPAESVPAESVPAETVPEESVPENREPETENSAPAAPAQ